MAFFEEISRIHEDKALYQAYSSYSEGGFKNALLSFTEIDSGESDYCVGFIHLNGKGTKEDEKKAFSFFKSAMEKGYVPAIAEVAQCYGYGIGVRTDDSKAFELFLKSAEAGDPYGMSMLSMMYRNGDGVKRSNKYADEWSEKCEEAGDLDEYEDLGLDYLINGNTILGRLYLMRSAVMGSPVSAKALEIIYSHGEGVSPNEDESSDWRDTAQCNGWDEVDFEDLKGYQNWFSKFIDIDDLGTD